MSDLGQISRQGLAVVRSPDRRTRWLVVVVASIEAGAAPDLSRVHEVTAAAPLLGARLIADHWVTGPPPPLIDIGGMDPLDDDRLFAAIDLGRDAPLRIAVGAGGSRVALIAHHAAFDGRSLVAVLGALLGGDVPPPAAPSPVGRRAPDIGGLVRRFLRPADRVSSSTTPVDREAFAVREIPVVGPNVTARLAAACADAARVWNHGRSAPWRRVGISLAVGGPHGMGNVASYRRVDVTADDDIHEAAAVALRKSSEPGDLVAPSRYRRLVAPVASRFSDSFLVSNLGRVDVRRAHRVAFFPVARGRSAIAFGAATVGSRSTLTLRARDLTGDDAQLLLDAVVSRWR